MELIKRRRLAYDQTSKKSCAGGFFDDAYCNLKSLITMASRQLQTAIYYLRLGPDKAVERTSAFERTMSCCEQAKGVVENNLQTVNRRLESRVAEIGQVEGKIDTFRGTLAKVQEKEREYQKRISTYKAELEQAERSYSELEGNISSQKRKVKKKKKKAGIWGAVSIVVAPIAPILLPITLGGCAAEAVGIDQANTRLHQLKDLRDEKQKSLQQFKGLKDDAVREKKGLSQELLSKEKELASLRETETQLRGIIRHLGEVCGNLKKLTCHLSTLHGKTKCVTMESRQITKNPFANTEGLVARTGVLASQMYQVYAQLSLESINPNTVTDEKYACVLLANIEAINTGLDI